MDKRPVADQVKSGFKIAGAIIISFAAVVLFAISCIPRFLHIGLLPPWWWRRRLCTLPVSGIPDCCVERAPFGYRSSQKLRDGLVSWCRPARKSIMYGPIKLWPLMLPERASAA